MATAPNSETMGDLLRLSAALATKEDDFQHMPGALAEFQRLVVEVQEAALQQAALTAAKQEATQRFQALLKAGHEHAVLLRNAARVRYGRSSDRLVALGIQPFRGRKTAPTPAPETPAAAELDA
ncbi:MAG TPA: hypothetical protein VHN15_09995 [Thermoanaerobaculia bacterium]|nr:hypothetical protein [Thermoanaerobaculia bacterium]